MSNVCYQKVNTILRLFELLNLRVFRNFKYLYRQVANYKTNQFINGVCNDIT